jgi:isocitrate dehydrogenase
MTKIKVDNPVVELDGDEMTRIIWDFIKQKLILPYLDIDLKYYDLGIEERDRRTIRITVDAANAIKQHGVGVKCATITPDEAAGRGVRAQADVEVPQRDDPQHPGRRDLPRADHRSQRPRLVPHWTQPIVVGRHAFGDQYRATDFRFPGKGTLSMKFVGEDGQVIEREVFQSPAAGVAMGMYNLDDSIADFARASFNYGVSRNMSVYLSTKNTILKAYDGRFKDLFQQIFDAEFAEEFRRAS